MRRHFAYPQTLCDIMRKLLKITFILILTTSAMSSQTNEKLVDSRDYAIYRSFDSIPKIKYLDSIATFEKKQKRYNSILGCLMHINSRENDAVFRKQIHLRLRDFSKKLCSENNFVILVSGSSCESYAEEKNINGKIVEIHYLCVSSGCISSKAIEDAKNEFNNETRNLLGWKIEEKKKGKS